MSGVETFTATAVEVPRIQLHGSGWRRSQCGRPEHRGVKPWRVYCTEWELELPCGAVRKGRFWACGACTPKKLGEMVTVEFNPGHWHDGTAVHWVDGTDQSDIERLIGAHAIEVAHLSEVLAGADIIVSVPSFALKYRWCER